MADRSRDESQGPLGTYCVRPLAVRRLPIIWWHSPDGSDGAPSPTAERAPDPKGLDLEAILNDLTVREPFEQPSVMADQDDARAQFGQFAIQLLDAGQVQVIGRLVEKQDVG